MASLARKYDALQQYDATSVFDRINGQKPQANRYEALKAPQLHVVPVPAPKPVAPSPEIEVTEPGLVAASCVSDLMFSMKPAPRPQPAQRPGLQQAYARWGCSPTTAPAPC